MTEALLRRVPAAGLLLAAAAVAYSQAHRAIHSINPGIDFVRLYHAGTALIHGTSIYADKQFIYPPSAAPVFAPLGALKYAIAFGESTRRLTGRPRARSAAFVHARSTYVGSMTVQSFERACRWIDRQTPASLNA